MTAKNNNEAQPLCTVPMELAITLYPTAPAPMQELFRETFGEDFWKPKKTVWEEVVDVVSLNKYLKYDVRPIADPKDTKEKAINAFAILTEVTRLYNNAASVEWKKGSIKFLPYLNLNEETPCVRISSAKNYMYTSHFMYFVSGKLAQLAYDNFSQEFHTLWDYQLLENGI
jgi:hypothetical protein